MSVFDRFLVGLCILTAVCAGHGAAGFADELLTIMYLEVNGPSARHGHNGDLADMLGVAMFFFALYCTIQVAEKWSNERAEKERIERQKNYRPID